MSRMLVPLLLLALLLSAVTLPQTQAVAQSVFIAWEQRYDSGRADYAYAVAVDSDDNVIVTGRSETVHVYQVVAEDVGTGDNSTKLFTLKHHPIINGSETIYLDGNQTTNYTIDYGNGTITFDAAPGAGIAITADYEYETANDDYYTIKYDPGGSELWNRTYDSGGSDEAHGVAVDLADNIIVTGYLEMEHVYYVVAEDVGTGNGTETHYTLEHYPLIVGSEIIYLDGQPQEQEMHQAGEDVGTGNGTETNFTLEYHPVIVGSETIYLDGQPQEQEKHQPGEAVGTGNGTETNFTLEYHPVIVGSETIYLNGTPQERQEYQPGEAVGIGDNSTTVFTLAHHPVIVGSETIYLDGNQTTNYTIDYGNGTITFDTPPAEGVAITADYEYVVYTVDYVNGIIAFSAAPAEGVAITADYEYVVYTIDYVNGTIAFSVAPAEGVAITADYNYIVYTINYNNGTITFSVAPAEGVAITADYEYEAANDDYYTIKYGPQGNELWNKTYDSGGVDRAFGVAVDSSGNIAVTGRSNDDYYTIKYAPNGTELWSRTYDGGDEDWANGVAVDKDDTLIVTGYVKNATGTDTNDYYTIKYTSNGTELWNVTYDTGGNDCAQDVAVDAEGNIAVTGGCMGLEANSTWYYCTVKYHPNGTQFWAEPVTYHSPYTYRASGEAVGTGDGSKTVFRLGYRPVIGGSEKVYLNNVRTTAYTIDYGNGTITFTVAPGNGVAITADYGAFTGATAFATAVDSEGNIITTGRSYYLPFSIGGEWPNIVVHPEISHYYYTIKYSPDGDEIWNGTYDRPYQESAYAVAVDSEDNIIVTGKGSDGKTWNYVTIKYAEQSEMAGGGSGGPIAVIVLMSIAAIGGVVYYFVRRRRIGGVVYYSIRGRIDRVVDYFARGRKRR